MRNDEGLTKTYNRFHDPYENDAEIAKLRELHAAMDHAVLDAYGWTDIPTDCEFLLDYEIDEEEWGNRKKPYRYRWPDDVRDEVLARFLELNAERAAADNRAGNTHPASWRSTRRRESNFGATVTSFRKRTLNELADMICGNDKDGRFSVQKQHILVRVLRRLWHGPICA